MLTNINSINQKKTLITRDYQTKLCSNFFTLSVFLLLVIVGILFPTYAIGQSFSSVSSGAGLMKPSIDAADYNNDGKTDVLLTGNLNTTQGSSYLFQNNGSNSFTEVGTLKFPSLPAIMNGAIAWSDYNRDGYIDFAIAGKKSDGSKITQLYRNGGPSNNWVFTQDIAIFPGIDYAALSWADVNKDGFPDIFISGKNASNAAISQLYINDGSDASFTFTLNSTSFTGLYNGSSDWADYNRDGLMDLVLTGNDDLSGSSSNYGNTLIYTNLGNGIFSLLNGLNINPYGQGNSGYHGNAEWGDYNNDGYSDLIVTGSGNGSSIVYKNNQNGSFSALTNLINIQYGKGHWGDFNNDGYLDLGITGFYSAGNGLYNMCFNLYTNNKNETFSQLQNPGTGYMMYSDFVWYDLDSDYNLDIFISGTNNGSTGSLQIYVSNIIVNTTPNNNSPISLQSFPLGDKLYLKWKPASGDSIATYNIYLSDSNDNLSVSPDALTTTGKRKIVASGNQYGNYSYLQENLPSGNYYWGVQSIYPNQQGSRFAYQGPITIPNNAKKAVIQIIEGSNVFCAPMGPTLKALSYPQASSWQWYLNNVPIQGATQQTYTVNSQGTYYAACNGYNSEIGGSFSINTNNESISEYPSLSAPVVSSNTVTVCYGQNIVLTATPGSNATSCLWYHNGILINSGDSLSVNPMTNITYQIYSYNPITNCQSVNYTSLSVIANSYINQPIVSNTTICDSSAVNLTATPALGTTCRWYNSNSPTAILLFTGNTFPTPVITANTTYYVSSYQESTSCESSRSALSVNVTNRPNPPTTQNAYVCSTSSILLVATPPNSNTTCNWYSSLTSITPFHQGNSYNTTPISHDTVFYVTSVIANTNCESSIRKAIIVSYRPEMGQPISVDQTSYVNQIGQSARVQLWAYPTQYGNTCKWYSDSGLKNYLSTGNSYLTPSINSNKTYYVTNYDATTSCEGSQATAVRVTIALMPTRTLNPDYVYPVASIPGDQSEDGINLASGDLIPSFEIAQISSGSLQYSLKVQYNSRSAAITPYVTNSVGGLGWKLLDYPKMVYDDELKSYYYLDGKNVYKLDTASVNGNQITWRTDGEAFFNQFVLDATSSNMENRTWIVTTEHGIQYYFYLPATSSLSNGQGGNIWNLSKIGDTQHLDSLTFNYSNNLLSSIVSTNSTYLNLAYGNGLLSSITTSKKSTNGTLTNLGQTVIGYNRSFAPISSASILSSIQFYINGAIASSSSQWIQKAPATLFYYNTSNFNGALEKIVNEDGGTMTFTYENRSYESSNYNPVTEKHVFSGSTFATATKSAVSNCSSTTYTYLGQNTYTPYSLFNYVSAYPGTSEAYTHLKTLSTGFENSSNDLVFANIDKQNISSDQYLSGKKSYFFNSSFSNVILQSQKFTLNKPRVLLASDSSLIPSKINMSYVPDSITISYFINQTHQTLDVTHVFSYRFFNSTNKVIGSDSKEIETVNQYYGQWVQVIQRFAIPDNAVNFDFSIAGGSSIYYFDFYLDVVTVSGAAYAPQGRIDYYFYNGKLADSLRHLPEAYRELYQQDSILKLWHTGFEQSTFTNEWLILGNNNDPCYPVVTMNNNNFEISYAGSSALRMNACSNGNYSQIRMPNLAVPSTTTRAKIAFRYSRSQIKGLQFKVHVEWNGGSKDSTISLKGSYLIDPHYELYFDEINIPNNISSISISIAVVNAGTNTKVNSFYIDNLQIACFANKLQSHSTPSTSVNATDATLIGKMYCQRILKNTFNEIYYNEKFYLPTITEWGSKVPQLYANLSVERANAISYTIIKYNTKALPINAITCHELTDEQDKPYVQLTNNQLTYTSDIYAGLARNKLSMYATPVAITSLVKNLTDSDWKVNDCKLTQWQNYSNNVNQSLWMPWRSFILQKDTNINAVSTVLSNTISNNNYFPPTPLWTLVNQVMQRTNKGLPIYSMSADSVCNYIQYSNSSYTIDNKTYNTKVLPVAVFKNATPQNSFYYGFEVYEQSSIKTTGANNTTFACTGLNSIAGNLSIGYSLNNAKFIGNSYVFSFWTMPQSNTIPCTIKGNLNVQYVNKTFSIPDSLLGKWIYLEVIFSINATSDSLIFNLVANSNTNFDDIRFSPVIGDFSAMVYQKPTNNLIAKLDNNGQVQKYVYSSIGEPICTINSNNVPTNVNGHLYYSRLGINNGGSYKPTDPNSQISVSTNSGGKFYNFNCVNQQNSWTGTGSNSGFSNGQISLGQNSGISLRTSYLPADASHYALSFQWSANNNTNTSSKTIKLQFGSYSLTLSTYSSNSQIKATWSAGNTNFYFPLNCVVSQVTPIDILLVFNGNNIWLWVNGSYSQLSSAYVANNGKGLSITNIGSSGSINYIDNVSIQYNPVTSVTYLDGLNNTLQSQVTEGDNILLSANLYDDMYRPAINTKIVRISNATTLSYNSSFVTNFDWYTGVMQGTVDNANIYNSIGNQDNGYFYYRTVYEGAPTTSVSAQFQAGKDFALRTYSTWEKGKRWAYDNLMTYINDAITVIGYTIDAVTIILDPAAAPEIIIMDAANIIATYLAASDDNTDKEYPVTKYLYNSDLQLTKIKLPQSNLKSKPDNSQVILLDYDDQGNTSSLITPESGTHHSAYDYLNRVRITQNDIQKRNNKALYYKYDKLGRIVEQGEFTLTNWNINTLEQNCSNPDYPNASQNSQVISKYYYDGYNASNLTYGSVTCRGRVNSIFSFDNGQQIHRKDLEYNKAGQVISETQSVNYSQSNIDSFKISYSYNVAGQTTKINYPPINNHNFWVSYQYNSLGQCAQISTSNDANFAKYTYNPDGSLQKADRFLSNGNRFPEYRNYNAPGWLSAIAVGDTISNKPRYFTYSISYNLLEDWWSSLWGQSYYNGNVASTNYTPGPNTNLQTLKDGYTYNPYNSLESYYSNYVNAEIFDGVNSYVSETMDYDVNGNIKTRGYEQERGTGDFSPKGSRQSKFKYNGRNQPKEMDFYLQAINWHWYGSDNTYNYDTTFMKYDDVGNVNTITYNRHNTTSDINKKGSLAEQTIRNFNYNINNLLLNASFSSTNQIVSSCNFNYDAHGLRLTKTTSISNNQQIQRNFRKTYVNAFNNHILSDKIHNNMASYADTMRYYVWGPMGTIEAMYKSTNGTNYSSYWVLQDHLGTARQLIDRSNASISSAWAYNEYGQQLPDLQRNSEFYPYLFTGQEFDPEIGLYNYKARMYEPSMTQFLSPDPAMQSPATPYAYVANNPTNFVDPTGMVRITGLVEAGTTIERDLTVLDREVNTSARFVTNIPLNEIPENLRGFAGHIEDWAPGTGFTGVMDYGANGNPDYFIIKPTSVPGGEVRYADNSIMNPRLVPNRQGGHIQASQELDELMRIERKNHDSNDISSNVSQWDNVKAEFYGNPKPRDRRGGVAIVPTDDLNIKKAKWKSHNINSSTLNFSDDVIPFDNLQNDYRQRIVNAFN